MPKISRLLWIFLISIIVVQCIEKTAPDLSGKVCAFGDFNADRNTDILVFSNGSLTINYQETKLLDVMEASKFSQGTSFRIGESDLNQDSVECSVGDFDGDSRLDVLVSIRDSKGVYNHTLWTSDLDGDRESFSPFHVDYLLQHAMTIDVTNDGLTDILGFYPNGSMFCTKVQKDGSIFPIIDSCVFEFKSFPDNLDIYQGMPHLFVDLNSDLIADIVFMTVEKKGLKMSVWQHTKTGWQYRDWVPLLTVGQYPHVAAPVVMDMDSDGEIDVVVPICKDETCVQIIQLASYCKTRGWASVTLDMQDYLVKPEPHSLVVFRVGEFTLDSFPDITAIVQATRANTRPAVKVIENSECKNCEKNGTRRFDIRKADLIQPKNMSLGVIRMSTFFDLMEDGLLDILVEYEYANETRFGFMYCPDKGDTTFLKVQVFTGVCSDNRCNPKSNEIGSSISMTGACASFSMTDGWGGSTQSVACQVPASSHRALYLPFLLYGLGRSPNFVDELNIAIPKYADRKEDWKHSLKQIVPNSRIIVLPPSAEYPHWTSRLYVTPSALIVQSLAVIAVVCCMLLMVVFFLHYREKKEDRYERQQQSHRFHFDAM